MAIFIKPIMGLFHFYEIINNMNFQDKEKLEEHYKEGITKNLLKPSKA